MCHVHKDRGGHRLQKKYRLANRLVVSIILCCLPTAHKLDSLELIGLVTALILWVLLLELWGISCPDETFFGEKRACEYTARCKLSRRELEAAVKEGRIINTEELGEGGEKGVYELS